ncbi:hypothetical protein IEQ34_005198 [Dendrobium chrysotoxum]|uniref:Pectinesterase inhibitor domain-containing protein n=1 Tax=Dendrobium chrysotoxum TaxID=161865 RepID=A0AAV7HC88_DENCH|nr:hypothetical protein IEQ34_005198 [Dendrobium chrysotoxum]
MVNQNLSFFFLFLPLLIQINLPLSTLFVAADVVVDTCKQIAAGDPELDYSICVYLFNSSPGSHKADLKGLAIISIGFTLQNAQHVLDNIDKLIKREPGNTYKKKCLSTCKENYDDAVSDIRDANKAIELGRISDARTELSASFDVADTCEDCFTDGNIQSPLTKDDDYYTSVARVPLAIAALLDK